jgi:hypothetical protein
MVSLLRRRIRGRRKSLSFSGLGKKRMAITQSSLFDAPFVSRSETSREAAEFITPKVPALQVRVLDYIKTHGPVTDSDIIEGLGIAPNSARPRRIELMHAGLIKQGGVVRQTNGRKAATWVFVTDVYCGREMGADG